MGWRPKAALHKVMTFQCVLLYRSGGQGLTQTLIQLMLPFEISNEIIPFTNSCQSLNL